MSERSPIPNWVTNSCLCLAAAGFASIATSLWIERRLRQSDRIPRSRCGSIASSITDELLRCPEVDNIPLTPIPKEDAKILEANARTELLKARTNGSTLSESQLKSIDLLIEAKLARKWTTVTKRVKAISARTGRMYPPVQSNRSHKRILVTGGAGFVGSNLVDVLMQQGHQVYVLDNLFTGRRRNIEHWMGHPHFEFFQHDVTQPFYIEVDEIYHLACPASPPHYQHNPIKTIKCSTHGTLNMLGLAKRVGARILFTSTSEIYGDPQIHPQPESYWGNVNTFGPRSCYDEGKRVAESMCYAYRHQNAVEVRIARVFNTFGPRMEPDDGRVVSNFIKFALLGDPSTPLEIYGTGQQTRSFQYVGDLVQGLICLMHSDIDEPVNIGNPKEYTILEWAEAIRNRINPSVKIVHVDALVDDPKVRQPDISRAKSKLHWEPKVDALRGLEPTISYFKHVLGLTSADDPPVPQIWLPSMPNHLK